MSAAVFLQLEEVLQSKGKLSKWEEELLFPIKTSVVTDFLKGTIVSSSVAWPALRAIPTASRLSLSIFAGYMGGRMYGLRSINAGLDKFLGLEGSRIQTELASLILREYKDDESLLMLVRKHFYSEPVFVDVNPDVPLFRWQPRNSYADSTTSSSDYNPADGDDKYKIKTNENKNWDHFVDPLECVFGYTEDSTEIKPMRKKERAEVLSKRQARALKKAHRRQRSSNDVRLS